MCKHGQYKLVNVLIPKDLSHSGESYWKSVQIDYCIADLIEALQNNGINMRGSCCGHNKKDGEIHLQDGRLLLIIDKKKAERYLANK